MVVGMSVSERVSSDHQLARLLQIGVVLEELVEARAYHHYQSLSESEQTLDDAVAELLEHARTESARHRNRLEDLIDQLDADSVPVEEIETLVEETYGQTGPDDFDGVLYDQLAGEETAYKFYDDLITAISNSDVSFSINRSRLLSALEELREEEAAGVERVTEVMRKQ